MLGVDPFSVHVNYNEGGLRGKRHRMREAGLWMDPPAYFETFNGYVQVAVFRLASARCVRPEGAACVRKRFPRRTDETERQSPTQREQSTGADGRLASRPWRFCTGVC